MNNTAYPKHRLETIMTRIYTMSKEKLIKLLSFVMSNLSALCAIVVAWILRRVDKGRWERVVARLWLNRWIPRGNAIPLKIWAL
jgi:hypothetical protein